MPALAPASIDMLQIVIRPSIERARIADPRYSMIEPMPPPVPISPMMARMTSLAVEPGWRSPSTVIAIRFGRICGQRLRGEHMLDLARADAEGKRAERAMRRGVAVAANDRHAGQGEALLGTDDMNDALTGIAHRMQTIPQFQRVSRQHRDLLRRNRDRRSAD